MLKDTTKICVMGLGYIGLPTASILATHGFEVLGIDVNQQVVDTLSTGRLHIQEPGLDIVVKAAVQSEKLHVASAPRKSDVFILAVPTPLRKEKGQAEPQVDLSHVVSATEAIAPLLERGNLVILESTSPPGTTTETVGHTLKELTGLEPGEDFLLCHCPERVLPGKILRELTQNDRIIGGVNRTSSERAKEIYQTFSGGEIFLTDCVTAELCKLVENSYRDVNIAFANEVAAISRKFAVNVYDVIAFANKHPRVEILSPGPGVGGHCISVDPWFLAEYASDESHLIKQARAINDQRPADVAKEVLDLCKERGLGRVSVLGVTYKPDVDDTRESPSTAVIHALRAALGDDAVHVHDPMVDSNAYAYPIESLFNAVADSDLIVFLVAHREFRLIDSLAIGEITRNKLVVDYMQCIDAEKWKATGFEVFRMGGVPA